MCLRNEGKGVPLLAPLPPSAGRKKAFRFLSRCGRMCGKPLAIQRGMRYNDAVNEECRDVHGKDGGAKLRGIGLEEVNQNQT